MSFQKPKSLYTMNIFINKSSKDTAQDLWLQLLAEENVKLKQLWKTALTSVSQPQPQETTVEKILAKIMLT